MERLEQYRPVLAQSMIYTASEEERLRGGRAGIVAHLLSPEHQEGLPIWLRGLLPVPYHVLVDETPDNMFNSPILDSSK